VYLTIITNNLVMYTPVVNLVFFVYLVRKFNDVVEIRVRCWEKLLVQDRERNY